MGIASFFIYGPADGFVAFRFPGSVSDLDDRLALSGSEAVLPQGTSAYKFSRLAAYDGTHIVRIAIFRQIYEPNLKRDGHAYGAAIEFHGASPQSADCIAVLRGLADTIQEYCVSGAHFCNSSKFNQFVSVDLPARLGRDLHKAFSELQCHEQQHEQLNHIDQFQRETIFYRYQGSNLDSEASRLLDWFLYGIGGTRIPAMICSSDNVVHLGPSVKTINDLGSIDNDACKAYLREREILLARISEMKADFDSQNTDYMKLREAHRKSDAEIAILKSSPQNSFHRDKPDDRHQKSVLMEADHAAIRRIVGDVLHWHFRKNANNTPHQNADSDSEIPPRKSFLNNDMKFWVYCIAIGLMACFFIFAFWIYLFPV